MPIRNYRLPRHLIKLLPILQIDEQNKMLFFISYYSFAGYWTVDITDVSTSTLIAAGGWPGNVGMQEELVEAQFLEQEDVAGYINTVMTLQMIQGKWKTLIIWQICSEKVRINELRRHVLIDIC